jgi:hypothetical protein
VHVDRAEDMGSGTHEIPSRACAPPARAMPTTLSCLVAKHETCFTFGSLNFMRITELSGMREAFRRT